MPISIGLAVFAALATAGTSASTDPGLAIRAKAEACIRDNAAAVERNQPDLSSAADFLVQYLCADEIRIDLRYQISSRALAAWKAGPGLDLSNEPVARTRAARQRREAESVRRRAYFDAITIDPSTGELTLPTGPIPLLLGALPGGGDTEIVVTGQATEPTRDQFRAIAGRAVLAARLQRQKP